MPKLRIGIDFDNTLICYDNLFYDLALEKGWISIVHSRNKNEIKQTVTKKFDDDHWQDLQALAYGTLRILEADFFPGVIDFFKEMKNFDVEIFIVSHKSEFSHKDPSKNLHKSALSWMEEKSITSYVAKQNINFCPTIEEKVLKISELKCDLFIDDLSKVFELDSFPQNCLPFLFNSNQIGSWQNTNNWEEVASLAKKVSLIKTNLSKCIIELNLLKRDGNNRIYIATEDNGEQFVLKSYSFNQDDLKRRGRKESDALFLLWENKIKQIPKALYYNSEFNFGCYQFLEGEELEERNLNSSHEDQIVDFILSMERLALKIDSSEYHLATDGRSCLKDYMMHIERRLEPILIGLKKSKVLSDAFGQTIKEVLVLKEAILSDFIEKSQSLSLDIESKFKKEEVILSPSDFGFHNMKLCGDKIFFFDFEYFGVDDPAKLWADFYHHVGFELSREKRMLLINKYMNLSQIENFKLRFDLILDMVGLEWVLIVLNICGEGVIERRLFSNPNETEESLIEKRRGMVKSMIEELKQRLR